ncbi:MAG: Gfo/Idh/MocA family oxidoreductase [Anaerohalosphaeraceae bacterium]|nr:Gfo/Idh/MocA family oxidoreductase [Anaerohalosphaeraceae bacterium]
MGKYKVAFIGTGHRSARYASTYVQCKDIDIVALADPVAENRKNMCTMANIPAGFSEYDNWEDMLREHKDLNGVVIGSPNHAHTDQAVACLELGIPIALEKPIATNQKDCERIIDTQQANNGRVLVGFVLHTTPFYSKIYELIKNGSIGRIVSIQADELPGIIVSSAMSRSPWRRYQDISGGAMLEKCCHDMDALNWLIDSRPVSINSYGGSLIFKPNPELPQICDDCNLGDTCQYHQEAGRSSDGELISRESYYNDYGCIYNIEKDCADVQSLNIQYENGVIANFMLNFNCMGPRASRNFHAIGTKGRIWGNLREKKVFLYDNSSDKETCFDIYDDGSGHSGGDRVHSMILLKMMEDPQYHPEPNAFDGYISAMMCFASDQSRLENRRVNLEYAEDGYVRIV